MRSVGRALGALVAITCYLPARAAGPVHYHVSFPEPQHRWMQVEATFPDIASGMLELRVSRSSPGRYSLHEFAKNVYDVHVFRADGHELEAVRPDANGWNVTDHGGSVTVKYKVYGDRVDGTYLGVDETHAHINMPAAFMWAHGLDERPITMSLERPPGAAWQPATQLHPGSSPLEFSAPNLQYFMDSPVEFGPIVMREFSAAGRTFRIALHHMGTDAEFDTFAGAVQRVVKEEAAVFGELPDYEPGSYTFLVDLLPWADGDGMEHRNSTVITGRASLAHDNATALDSVAHEFFHCWNVERIRPKGLEPFDFDRANISAELWLAEGFTQYYGPLMLHRAGLVDLASTAETLTGLIEAVTQSHGRLVRSAEQMSQMAPFIDGGRSIDRTNWSTTVISYYPFGGAIALAMDLALRDRSDGRLALDDYMRALWRRFGKNEGSREGYVDHPYTINDAEDTLAEVAGDRSFAREFFARFIEGHEAADYGRLLGRAGFVVRKRSPGQAWLGDLRLDFRSGARVAALVSPDWPIYSAGLDQDDEIQAIDGHRIAVDADLAGVVGRHKPGDVVSVTFIDRTGATKTAAVRLAENPHLEVVPVESTGSELTSQHRQFRDRWLKSRS
jgi:predicted metalloprotease with PDZ domain